MLPVFQAGIGSWTNLLQVGIFGDITKWQRKFERMAEHYDTEETEGLHELLQGDGLEALQCMLMHLQLKDAALFYAFSPDQGVPLAP